MNYIKKALHIFIIISGTLCPYVYSGNIFVESTANQAIRIDVTPEDSNRYSLVIRSGELHYLGESNTIKDIELSAYGKNVGAEGGFAGFFRGTYSIIEKINKASNTDCMISLFYEKEEITPPTPPSETPPQKKEPGILENVISYASSWWAGTQEPTTTQESAESTATTPSLPEHSFTKTLSPKWYWNYDITSISIDTIKQKYPTPKNLFKTYKTETPRYFLGLAQDKYSDPNITSLKKNKATLFELVYAAEEYKEEIKRANYIINQAAKLVKKRQNETDEKKKEYLLFEWDIALHADRVSAGKKVAYNLVHASNFSHKEDPTKEKATHLNRIINLMWYFYHLAAEKKQAFSEGTFVITDPNNTLYNFLLNYTKLMNNSVKGTTKDPAQKIEYSNQYAYPRLSSHFKKAQKEYRHYGIDIRFPPEGKRQYLLPAQKTHILFGKTAPDLFFIKLENHGIYRQEVPLHGSEFITSQLRKIGPKLNNSLKKYVSKEVLDNLLYYIGTDDDPNYRKERVPAALLEHCFNILGIIEEIPSKKTELGWDVVEEPLHIPEDNIRKQIQLFAQKGIQYLKTIADNPPKEFSNQQKQQFKKYLKELQAKERFTGYKIYDHISMRHGREVIILYDELKKDVNPK